MSEVKTKCGYVTIFGLPNAGKSTLMNALLGVNLSIVNKKAQTTRNRILGILTEDDYQAIFLDTPGVLEPKYELQKFMQKEIKTSLEEADVVMHILDIAKVSEKSYTEYQNLYGSLLTDKKVITVLNKSDIVTKDDILVAIGMLSEKFGVEDIVPVSALNGYNIPEVKKMIADDLPEMPFLYDEDTLTDRPERFFVSEMIRQKTLELLQDEIPYSIMVEVIEFKERDNGKDYISAEIITEKESQKTIIIGSKGEMLKRIGQHARKNIERFLGREVFLEIFVKVRKNWRKNENFLRSKF